MNEPTDAELLKQFRRMHPTYTAATLEKVLCIKRAMSFLVLRSQRLEEYQRRLLSLYLDLPKDMREKHFT